MPRASMTKEFAEQRLLKPIYGTLLGVMGLTGFAQMPIFKRYYIADIPGLGWLGQFYVTHYMHYIGAILLLTLLTYAAIVYLALLRRRYRLTASARVKIVLLTAIVVTGIGRVLKNLPDVVFSPGVTMFLDISHLGFMMLLLGVAVVSLITRDRWLTPVIRGEMR